MLSYLLLPYLAFLLSSSQCETRESFKYSYPQHRLIAVLEESTKIYLKDGEILFSDNEDTRKVSDLGVNRITRIRQSGMVNRTLVNISYDPVRIELKNNVDVAVIIPELIKTGLFSIVEPDYIGNGGALCSTMPFDLHFYNRQWGLFNDGTFDPSSVDDADIDMDQAWRISTGDSSIVVCIIDSGTRLSHPELHGRLWQNSFDPLNGIDDEGNGYIDDFTGWDFVNNNNNPIDDFGHGTNIAGIIASNANNFDGYTGIDWNCKIMTCKALDDTNSGLYSWWIEAIYYAVDNGADIINMSLGGTSQSLTLKMAIDYAYSENIPVFAAMMNANSNIAYYPAAYSNTIAIGAFDTNNERVDSFFSGGGSNYGSHIDIMAPGNYIYGLSHLSDFNFSTFWSGTSQATAYVTGISAILKGVDSDLRVDSLKTILYLGASDQVGRSTEDTKGWDKYHGYGNVKAYKSFLLATATMIHSCDPIEFKKTVYTESTTLFDTTETNENCDSVSAVIIIIQPIDTTITVSAATLLANAADVEYQWLDCNDNFLPVFNAIDKDFTPLISGDYAVEIRNQNCVDTSSCHSIVLSDINTVPTATAPIIYPNPAKGDINIKFFTMEVAFDLRLWSVNGAAIFKQSYSNAECQNLRLPEDLHGVYFIQVITKQHNGVYKIFID